MRARHGGLPQWPALIGPDELPLALQNLDDDATKVLVATGTGGHLPSITIESLLGVAVSQRGAEVDFLLCDGSLPACMLSEINWYSDLNAFATTGPRDRCQGCHGPAADMLTTLGIAQHRLAIFISPEARAEARRYCLDVPAAAIPSFSIDSVPVGEHALAGALRFFARGTLPSDPAATTILQRFFEAALLTYFATRTLLARKQYTVVVLNHGIYVPQGVIAETARRLGVRVVTWHPAYRRGCFIFNHDETYHQGLLHESTDSWRDMQWTNAHQERIQNYLRSRWEGQGDWIKFHSDPVLDLKHIQAVLGIDFSRPTIGLLTNVVWDAQLHYRANAFSSMLDWLLKSIAYFSKRPDLQLLIRIHPAELTGTVPSRQPALEAIRERYPNLPPNIFIIPPESKLSTYTSMSQCNAVAIYGTKTGVELAAMGIPVIVAGEAWIRGKGLTLDATSEADYFRLLDGLPLESPMAQSQIHQALKYAYHFFFRRMIPIDCVQERRGWPPFGISINSLDDLRPGQSRGLDIVCEGILHASPFVYPAEVIGDIVSS